MFDLCDRDPGGSGHDRVEIPRCLAINEITPLVAFPSLNEREISLQGALEHEHPAIIFPSFFAFSDYSSVARWREERRNTCSGCPDALRKRPLWHQLHLKLTSQSEFLEELVL